jgi:hypothetical protein
MTQYLLLVQEESPENDPYSVEGVKEQAYKDVMAFNERLASSESFVFVGALDHAAPSAVVNGRDGEPVVSDGPYSETKEHLGGFWIIEAPSLDAATAIALEASDACKRKIEVLPFEAE